MSCYQINGGTPLRGRLAVQGAKNSVLPILAAALLALFGAVGMTLAARKK